MKTSKDKTIRAAAAPYYLSGAYPPDPSYHDTSISETYKSSPIFKKTFLGVTPLPSAPTHLFLFPFMADLLRGVVQWLLLHILVSVPLCRLLLSCTPLKLLLAMSLGSPCHQTNTSAPSIQITWLEFVVWLKICMYCNKNNKLSLSTPLLKQISS